MLSPDQFERLEQARDHSLAGVCAAREVLVGGEGVAIAAERHGVHRQTIRKRMLGILERGTAVGETIGLRVQCAGHDPGTFTDKLAVEPQSIQWQAPSSLRDALALMRFYGEETHVPWPDLHTMLVLMPGSEHFEKAVARFFREPRIAIHARRQALLADYGARTGLTDIVIQIPAGEHERLNAIAARTPLAPKCPKETESNGLWELTSHLPYARSRATRRELFDQLQNHSRGRPSEGALGVTRRVFAEIGVGDLEAATPGVARAEEGLAAFSRMVIREHGARISRTTQARATHERPALARALWACRHEITPRLRSRAGREALKAVYLNGATPNSAFPEAGYGSAPNRDLKRVREALAGERAHVLLHYLVDEARKPELDAALTAAGAKPIVMESAAAGGARTVNAEALHALALPRRRVKPKISPLERQFPEPDDAFC